MNESLSTASLSRVTRLTKCVSILSLALWGLATIHCGLEQVTGLKFLACCRHADTAPHQDSDCDQDACSVVETGFYKMEEQSASVPMPFFVLSFVRPLWEIVPPTRAPNAELLSGFPPELARFWHFFHRTALPPRAPCPIV